MLFCPQCSILYTISFLLLFYMLRTLRCFGCVWVIWNKYNMKVQIMFPHLHVHIRTTSGLRLRLRPNGVKHNWLLVNCQSRLLSLAWLDFCRLLLQHMYTKKFTILPQFEIDQHDKHIVSKWKRQHTVCFI